MTASRPAGVTGRVAMVTGAGQGIGRVLALHFARAGARVAIAELDPGRAESVAAEICAEGGAAVAMPVDVTDAAAVARAVAQLDGSAGAPEILINNARWGGLRPTPAVEITGADWQRTLDVNVTGAFNCVQACIPAMQAAGWGRIVNLSSSTARIPPRQPYVHYVTSKAALVGMTRALARELGPDGITVNALLPGAVETEVARHLDPTVRLERAKASQAIPEVATAEDLVGAALFLVGEGSRFVTGQTLAVDGGYSFG